MPATLHIVSTPIGNLEDLTFRALRALREATLIAAEDTRRTAKLLQHYSISTRTTSLHEHNERQKVPVLLSRLRAGDAVALVCDAGTPTISDPGWRLVNAALHAGFRVEPVPGPSAILAALVSSGFPADSFTFLGFPPSRTTARSRWLQGLRREPGTLVFFESPHRIHATLREALNILGDREISVARELTKRHEELVKGPISEILLALPAPRGEFTVVLGPAARRSSWQDQLPGDRQIYEEFCGLTEQDGLSRRASLSILARQYGKLTRDIYATIERAKKLWVPYMDGPCGGGLHDDTES